MERAQRIPVLAVIAALLSLAWIAFALSEPGVAAALRAGPSAATLLDLATKVLVVPALLFAIAAAFRRAEVVVQQDLIAAAQGTESEAVATAGALAARLAAAREMLALDIAAVEALTSTLEERAGAAAAQLRDATAAADRISEVAQRLDASVSGGLAATGELTAALSSLAGNIEAQRGLLVQAGDDLAAMGERLAGIQADAVARHAALTQATDASAAALANETARIAADAETAMALAQDAARTLSGAIAEHRAAMEQTTAEARATVAAIGSEAARALGRHLDVLVGQARELEARIAGQAGATEELVKAADQGFQILDKRLAHTTATTGQTLDQLQARIQAAAAAIDALAEPVRTGRATVGELDQAIGGVRETALAVTDLLAGTLPQQAVAAAAAAETLGRQVRDLLDAIERAHARAEALADPVANSRAVVEEATRRFEAQREAVQIAGEALVVELEQARQLVAEVERTTEASSLAAATRLVDALSRVRDVSAQATGTMREMLEGVVAEAREALGKAAQESLEAGFVKPIAEQAAAAEASARAAAERSAQALAGLAQALKLVDTKAQERFRELADLGTRELVAAAQLLTDRMAAEAVTIASALGREMDAEDWAKWRMGERGLFHRRALALLDKREAKALKALVARDPEFASAARRLTAGFEAMVARLDSGEPTGLAAILRSSEVGRLAAALAEVLED
ncbi:hypothetical protein [Thermaurantiacus sp.]